jgi:hypothetical protein
MMSAQLLRLHSLGLYFGNFFNEDMTLKDSLS